jgi:hypothetical protein
MGFENFNPILNIGGIFFSFVYYVLLVVFALILKVFMMIIYISRPHYRKDADAVIKKFEE